MLKPDRYPTLRWSLFCGEPLPAELATPWAQAAPNVNRREPVRADRADDRVHALPLGHRTSPAECRAGVVPIGEPYPGMTRSSPTTQLHEVEPGADGELLLTGPQVTLGYWRDPEKTAAAFVVPPGRPRPTTAPATWSGVPLGDGTDHLCRPRRPPD